MPNRLAHEPSPYLLQHARNPVDWYPWGEEAFALARDRDCPIFLSIGYSTCHWCHVMEHESFEHEEIAGVLNDQFVPIKVDREERPDVDRVYMTFVQATTGSGGWPMSVWLTPQLKPFYGGTYFPPSAKWGRPGFIEILNEIAKQWRESRAKLLTSADGVVERLREVQQNRAQADGGRIPDGELLTAGVGEYVSTFDRRAGGFGDAPKFPRPAELLFLLREHARTGDVEARHMVLETLRAMALGGMRDHVGGGFHRYSVDAAWRVPHFEKMLYDQAQLVLAFLETSQAATESSFADVAHDTLAYVERELLHAQGGFFSAEDADSVPPEQAGRPDAAKSEGAFYIWSHDEVETLFAEDTDVVRFRYGVEPEGNAPQDPHGEFTKKNLLYVARGVDDVARLTGRGVDAVMKVLDGRRVRLFEARSQRPRPHLDDKVLTGWNGLMIAAFARAARVTPLDEPRAAAPLETAVRAAQFLRDQLWDAPRQRLLRRFRDGQAGIDGYAEDYAYVVWGLVELFQAGGDPRWLDWAEQLQDIQNELFWDGQDGGWFSTTGEDEAVLLRLKEDYDGAEPSAGSVSVWNLLSLAHLSDGEKASGYVDQIERALRRVPVSAQLARVVPMMMAAASMYRTGLTQVVLVGSKDDPETAALHRVWLERYVPAAVSVVVEPGEHQVAVAQRLPWLASMQAVDGRPTAYLCRDFTCHRPVTDPGELRVQLASLTRTESTR
ncbi:MAG: thioredoxin domain-containing protein [Acidobacteriota bacterium]|nr:thioredoxin domain-containing protein [Acidobacteriota bacterium]